MAEPITMQGLIDANVDADTLGEFANEDKIVTSRLGAEYPSAPMASRLLVENGLLGATPFSTYAAMTASALVDGDYAVVTNDADLIKNGVYKKQGGGFTYQKYSPVNKDIFNVDGVSIAITDAENNQTWLQANSDDGGLTPVAEQAVRDKLDIQIAGSTLMYAVTDADNNLTEMQINSSGLVPDNVLNAWSSRMGVSDVIEDKTELYPYPLPVMTGSTTNIHASDTYFKNGEVLPFMPDINKVMLTGSSSMERSTSYITTALKAINPALEVYSPAFSGAIVENQITAVGSDPMPVTFANNTILSSTAKQAVTIPSIFRFSYRLGAVEGWIDGVEGILSAVGNAVSFERKMASSSATNLNGATAFIPKLGNEYRNAIFVIWIGKNNLASKYTEVNDVDKLIEHTNKIIEFNASMVKRFVVMTHFNNVDTAEISEVRDKVNRCNRLYKLHYKQNVFDVESIILGTQIFTDLSITRTADDIAKQAIGNMPPSLAADNVHLKPEVYEYLAGKLADFINNKNFLEV